MSAPSPSWAVWQSSCPCIGSHFAPCSAWPATSRFCRSLVSRTREPTRLALLIVTLVGLVTVSVDLETFEPIRQFGVSLFASAHAAGLMLGPAMLPVLSNLVTGIRIAITRPSALPRHRSEWVGSDPSMPRPADPMQRRAA